MWRLRNGGEAGFPVAKSQRLTVVKLIWAERPWVPEQQRRGADDHRKYHRVQRPPAPTGQERSGEKRTQRGRAEHQEVVERFNLVPLTRTVTFGQ